MQNKGLRKSRKKERHWGRRKGKERSSVPAKRKRHYKLKEVPEPTCQGPEISTCLMVFPTSAGRRRVEARSLAVTCQ